MLPIFFRITTNTQHWIITITYIINFFKQIRKNQKDRSYLNSLDPINHCFRKIPLFSITVKYMT